MKSSGLGLVMILQGSGEQMRMEIHFQFSKNFSLMHLR